MYLISKGVAMTEFPKTLAAVERAEGADQWAIGDALIEEVGPPSSYERLATCANELEQHGYEYTKESLRQIRDVAYGFSKSVRRHTLSFGAHQSAGSIEMLNLVIKQAKNLKKPVTVKFTRATIKAIEEARRHTEQEERARIKAEAEEKERQAEVARQAEAEARPEKKEEAQALRVKAEAEATEATEKAKAPPAPAAPTTKQINSAALRSDFFKLISDCEKAADKALKIIAELEQTEGWTEEQGEQFSNQARILLEAWGAVASPKRIGRAQLKVV